MTSPARYEAPRPELEADPGSFRDPSGVVLYAGQRVLRALQEPAASAIGELFASGLLPSMIERGAVVGTRMLARDEERALYAALPEAALILEHERVPFISYPYEWPFEALRAAALRTLEVLSDALDRGYVLKDATPFNVQFAGATPRIIDVGSFERLEPGRPWAGYAQFCRTFLNPLLLQSLAGVPYQPWLRGSLEGIDPSQLGALLPLRQKLRPDVALHVVAQGWLDRRAGSWRGAESKVAGRRMPEGALRRLAGQLEGAVRRRKRRSGNRSHWVEYEAQCHYAPEATATKRAVVEGVLRERRPRVVWDLGCNTGQYSLLAARHARHVVAMDGDEQAVGVVYERALRAAPNVLPLVVDLANPSPDQGWAHQERRSLLSRGPADLALCLALMHHLVLGLGVPVGRFVDWLAASAREAVVEYVPPSDPQAQTLLRHRSGLVRLYDRAEFEHELARVFTVRAITPLPGCERVLYDVARR